MLTERMRTWAAGRSWHWRLPLLVVLLWQAVRPLGTEGSWTLFSGVNFGAHELGHLFWAPFGEWMGVAGGSLTQLLVPAGAIALMVHKEDWFGAAACGLFLASSLGELSWYIGDARAEAMDLVSFSEEGAIHDWSYLLRRAGMLRLDTALAGFTRFIGWCVALASTAVAARLLWWMRTLRPGAPSAPA